MGRCSTHCEDSIAVCVGGIPKRFTSDFPHSQLAGWTNAMLCSLWQVSIPTDEMRKIPAYLLRKNVKWLAGSLLAWSFIWWRCFTFFANCRSTFDSSGFLTSRLSFWAKNTTGYYGCTSFESLSSGLFQEWSGTSHNVFQYMSQSITTLIRCTGIHWDTACLTNHYHKVEKRLRCRKWRVTFNVPLSNGTFDPVRSLILISIVWNVFVCTRI